MLVLCYGGDTSRVATSVLRAKGVDAVSVGGGFQALQNSETISFVTEPVSSGPRSGWLRRAVTRLFSLLKWAGLKYLVHVVV